MKSTLRKLAVIFAASSALASPAFAAHESLASPLNPMSPNYILKSNHSMLDSSKPYAAEKPKLFTAEHQVILDQLIVDPAKTPDDLRPHLPPSYSTDVTDAEIKYLNGCRDDMKLANTYNAAAIKACMRNELQDNVKTIMYGGGAGALLLVGGLAFVTARAAKRDAQKLTA